MIAAFIICLFVMLGWCALYTAYTFVAGHLLGFRRHRNLRGHRADLRAALRDRR